MKGTEQDLKQNECRQTSVELAADALSHSPLLSNQFHKFTTNENHPNITCFVIRPQ